jgi:hypothetical protein
MTPGGDHPASEPISRGESCADVAELHAHVNAGQTLPSDKAMMRQRVRAGANQPVVCVFVCKSNSARSIAAECIATATARHAENYRFYSAGTARADSIKEPVQRALCRAGYSLDGLRSKSVQVGVKGIV